MMDEQIKHEERRVYCEGNYIGVILHSCDIEHREDDEITGVCPNFPISIISGCISVIMFKIEHLILRYSVFLN